MALTPVLRIALGAGLLLHAGLTAAAASEQWGLRPSDPLFLSSPMKALKLASLDLPQPLGTDPLGTDLPVAGPVATRPRAAEPARPAHVRATDADQDADDAAASPLVRSSALAPDLAAAPPADGAAVEDEGLQAMPQGGPQGDDPDDVSEILPGASFGPDLSSADVPALLRGDPPATAGLADGASIAPMAPAAPEGTALYHDPVAVFGTDPNLFPPLAFEYLALADRGLVPQPLPRPSMSFALKANNVGEANETPAEFLGLAGERLAKAERCMAQAIYFESRGEPKRGQIAVAQVVLNRVLSGYYPKDVCGTVYQNAHRRLACQFTFACDRVKDVVREPDMWEQAQQIAADMLGGRLWLDSVGRATHYHAYWVHPRWVREMHKLDRIGVHTFYRPRNWQG